MPPELVPWLPAIAWLIFSGWLSYEHRRVSAKADKQTTTAALGSQAESVDREAVALRFQMEALHVMLKRQVELHVHPYAAFDHDHPHEHEHVQHTHTLAKVSEHEENGKKVVVKKCDLCDTVFRDRQE